MAADNQTPGEKTTPRGILSDYLPDWTPFEQTLLLIIVAVVYLLLMLFGSAFIARGFRQAFQRAADALLLGSSSPSAPIDAFINVSVNTAYDKYRPVVNGKTNLPDETIIMVSVKGLDVDFLGQERVVVVDGGFSAGPFGPSSGLQGGTYLAEALMPLASVQPESVRKVIGENGEMLTGSQLIYDKGMLVVKTERFEIASPTPSLIIGESIDYLPTPPDGYEIEYGIPFVNTTSADGTKLLSIAFRNRLAVYPGDLVTVIYYISIYPTETGAISRYDARIRSLGSEPKGTLDSTVEMDGADASAAYLEPQDDGTLLAEYDSRIKNVLITSQGLTTYDSQDVTEAFLRGLTGRLASFHYLGISKLTGH